MSFSENTQSGGRVSLPPSYFDPSKTESYVSESNHTGVSFPNTELVVSEPSMSFSSDTSSENTQSGGTRLITGASAPPNMIQDIDQMLIGQEPTHLWSRQLSHNNTDMQLSQGDTHFNSSRNMLEATSQTIKGFENQGISDQTNTYSIGPQSSNTVSDVASIGNISGNDIHPAVINLEPLVPPSMAGGSIETVSVDFGKKFEL